MASSRSLLATLLAVTCCSSARGLTSGTTLSTPAPSSGCSYVGDGMCDSYNNVPECNYDGGDCCECDCVDSFYACGYAGYTCIDPDSTCQTSLTPAPTVAGCFSEGDGWCDALYNTAECNYDGGDCCECDCVDNDWTCGSNDFACIDPGSACQNLALTTPAPTPGASSTGCSSEGDGWCDFLNNNAECNYDGGDCCECDCADAAYTCGISGFTCIDPDSICLNHHYYDDDGESTVVTDDEGGGGTVVADDDGDDGTSIGGPVPIDEDDVDTDAADDDAAERSGVEEYDNGDDGDGAPVGIIVGGAVGGAVLLGALVILACCLKTGRLKGCKCCSPSTPAPAGVPPSAEGPAPAAVKTGHSTGVSSVAVDPAAAHPPPPPPGYHDFPPGQAPDVKPYPAAEAPLPPPPAYEGPHNVEGPRP